MHSLRCVNKGSMFVCYVSRVEDLERKKLGNREMEGRVGAEQGGWGGGVVHLPLSLQSEGYNWYTNAS